VSSPGEGRGSTFFFEIPVVDKNEGASGRVEVQSSLMTGRKNDSILMDGSGKSPPGRNRGSTASTRIYSDDRIYQVQSNVSLDNSRALVFVPGGGGSCRVGPKSSTGNTITPTHSLRKYSVVSASNEGITHDWNSPGDVNASNGNMISDGVKNNVKLGRAVSRMSSKSIAGNASAGEYCDEFKASATLSILLVDDASSNRKMVRRVLDKSLFIPDEAEDGLVAVSKVSQMVERGEANYDVILMDFMMPKMDGPTATRAIRGLGYTGIIIGVTGNSSPQDLEMFQISGADLVMPKPFDMDQLVANISSKFRRCNISVSFEFSTILKQCISFHLELLLKRSLVPKAAHGTVTPLTSHSILLPQEF